MNLKKTLKQTLYSACLYFTITEFILLAIATGFKQLSPEDGGAFGLFLSLGSTSLIFLACLIMALLNLIFRTGYSISVRILLHFIGSLAAFSLVFIIIPGAWRDVAQIIIRLIVFAAIYLIIAFVALIVGSIRRNKHTEEFEYESQFGRFSDR